MGNKDAGLRRSLEESYSKMIGCSLAHLLDVSLVLGSLDAHKFNQRRMSFHSEIYLHT
jgi:hypothetical protein